MPKTIPPQPGWAQPRREAPQRPQRKGLKIAGLGCGIPLGLFLLLGIFGAFGSNKTVASVARSAAPIASAASHAPSTAPTHPSTATPAPAPAAGSAAAPTHPPTPAARPATPAPTRPAPATPPATKPTPTPTPESEPATDQPQSPAPGAGGPATTGVIMSPTGHFYRAGEFCPTDDLGKSTVDSHGTAITCGPESGANHWHY